MLAYELLARLRWLVLVGYENGEYEFCGKPEDWAMVSKEEKKILSNIK